MGKDLKILNLSYGQKSGDIENILVSIGYWNKKHIRVVGFDNESYITESRKNPLIRVYRMDRIELLDNSPHPKDLDYDVVSGWRASCLGSEAGVKFVIKESKDNKNVFMIGGSFSSVTGDSIPMSYSIIKFGNNPDFNYTDLMTILRQVVHFQGAIGKFIDIFKDKYPHIPLGKELSDLWRIERTKNIFWLSPKIYR